MTASGSMLADAVADRLCCRTCSSCRTCCCGAARCGLIGASSCSGPVPLGVRCPASSLNPCPGASLSFFLPSIFSARCYLWWTRRWRRSRRTLWTKWSAPSRRQAGFEGIDHNHAGLRCIASVCQWIQWIPCFLSKATAGMRMLPTGLDYISASPRSTHGQLLHC